MRLPRILTDPTKRTPITPDDVLSVDSTNVDATNIDNDHPLDYPDRIADHPARLDAETPATIFVGDVYEHVDPEQFPFGDETGVPPEPVSFAPAILRTPAPDAARSGCGCKARQSLGAQTARFSLAAGTVQQIVPGQSHRARVIITATARAAIALTDFVTISIGESDARNGNGYQLGSEPLDLDDFGGELWVSVSGAQAWWVSVFVLLDLSGNV